LTAIEVLIAAETGFPAISEIETQSILLVLSVCPGGEEEN
jgi:hypothetical protein